jgi:DNA repair photolyase
MAQLRVSFDRARQQEQDAETPLFQLLPKALPSVERVRDHRRLLKTGSFAPQQNVLALEYVEGCIQGCSFCPVRAAGAMLAGGAVRLMDNVAPALAVELDNLATQPRAVFVSPSTDPFPPLNEIQAATARIVEVLAQRGIEIWLMTRGYIRPAALDVLRRYAEYVQVTMAMTTLDRGLQRLLEPLTAPPRLRLRNLAALREAGIVCRAALEPLVPGLTDTRDNLLPLLEALASVGVQHVTVGYLVLHPRTERAFLATLRSHGLDALVADEYTRGPIFSRDRTASGRYLPRSRRQHGYAALMAMAADFGIRVTVNAVTNPDFARVKARLLPSR